MATFTSTSGSYTTTLTVTQTSQSTQNNQSTLTYSLTLTKNSGTGLWNNNSCPWSITIDGSTVASGSFTYDFRSYSSLTLKGSTTTTVTHNSDGTKTVACSASVNMDNEPYVYVMKPSGDLALTTIPRASDISLSVSSFSITSASGNAFTWSITAKSSSFYNRLRYSIGNKTNITSNKGQGNSSGYFTNQELLSALPTSTSGSLTVYCDTYSDSGYTNLIGTKSVVITVSVNTANIKPSVSLGNIGLNSTLIANYAVAGYSKVQSAWTTTNSSGASSVTTYLSTSHGTLGTTSSTSTSGTTVSGFIPSSSVNYTLTISAYAKDSRGATSSTVSKSITVYGYTPPTATLNAYRVASSSSTTEDGAGTYAYVTFSGAVSASVNGQNSVQIISCSYWGSISGQATNGGHYALADTQTVTFTLTVTDKVTSSTAQKTINTATYPLDLYDNGSGSVGVGFGAVASGGWLTSGLKNDLSRGNKTRVGIQTAYESTNSTSGTGFMIIATIKPKGAWDNKAITFKILRRGIIHPSNVSVRFNGVNSTDPGLSSFVADFNSTDFYLYKSATSTWQLISYKTNYDQISILALYADDYVLSLNDIDTTQSVISAVPDGAVQATEWSYLHAQFATQADSATSATNATNANYAYGDKPNVFATNADLNTYTYLHGNWYSASSTLTNTIQNKPSGASPTLYLKNYPMSPGVPTASSTWYYDIQALYDYEGERWTRMVRGTATANTYEYGPWRKMESNTSIWTGSLIGGGNQITLTDAMAYARLRIYAFAGGGDAWSVWEIDVPQITTTARHFAHSMPMYISDPGDWYLSIFDITCLKSGNNVVITFANAINKRIGTSGQTTQNTSNYRIYRVDGII